MKHSVICFLVNVATAVSFIIREFFVRPQPDEAVIGFALGCIMWGVALLAQESTSAFRIRLLEHQKRQLELQLGFRQSISNLSKP